MNQRLPLYISQCIYVGNKKQNVYKVYKTMKTLSSQKFMSCLLNKQN